MWKGGSKKERKYVCGREEGRKDEEGGRRGEDGRKCRGSGTSGGKEDKIRKWWVGRRGGEGRNDEDEVEEEEGRKDKEGGTGGAGRVAGELG